MRIRRALPAWRRPCWALRCLGSARHGAPPSGRALGEVRFETSCEPDAHKRFNQAMLYQHSFWYSAAKRAFEQTLEADPNCAIAYWGVAQSLLLNPFGPPPAKSLADGLAALGKGEAIAAHEREKDFILALKAFYAEHDKRDHRARLQLYFKAMEEVAARYPSDDEAQIYYALALNVAASPSDKTYALPLKAAAILEPIFRRKPQHPGVAHYLVHTYDYPPIAEKGIEAAKRYAAIAGSSPHALHMPSHIFTRVGHWRESIASNLISAKVAKDDKEPDDQLHAMDYLVYAYLQLAQDDRAREIVAEMRTISGVNAARHTGPFALAAGAHVMRWSAATGRQRRNSCRHQAASPMSMQSPISRARWARLAWVMCRRQERMPQSSQSSLKNANRTGCLLGRASRYPAAGRGGVDSPRRGEV